MSSIGVREEQQLPGSLGCQLVAGPVLAQPTPGKRPAANQANALIVGGEPGHHCSRAVAGLIVQHEHFKVRVLLIHQRAQAGTYVPLFVAGRDQHRDHGPLRGYGGGDRRRRPAGTQIAEATQVEGVHHGHGQNAQQNEHHHQAVLAPQRHQLGEHIKHDAHECLLAGSRPRSAGGFLSS